MEVLPYQLPVPLLLVLLFLLAIAVGPHQFVAADVNGTEQRQSTLLRNIKDANCNKTTLDHCIGTIEPFLDSPSLARGIPDNEQAVHARCQMFKAGMNCIDDYKARCLTARQQQVIERGVAGARHTFAFLCDDPVFQAEFLQHQTCFKGTSNDWEHCASHFQFMVAEELALVNVSRAERNLGLCCAKHGFLRCVYYSAQFKCRKDGALFLMKVAQTLTDVQVHEDACRKIKFDTVCTGDGGVAAGTIITSPVSTIWTLVATVIVVINRHTLCWT